MQVDWDTVKYFLIIPAGWVGKLIWNNHKSVQDIRNELAANYPTWEDIKDEMKDQKEDVKYIRDKMDKLIERELDKK